MSHALAGIALLLSIENNYAFIIKKISFHFSQEQVEFTPAVIRISKDFILAVR